MSTSVARAGAVLATGALCSALFATLAAVALVWRTSTSPQGTAVQWGVADQPWTAGIGLAAVLVLVAARRWRRQGLAVLAAVLAGAAALTTVGSFGDDGTGPAPWLALTGYLVAALLAAMDARELS